MNLKNFVVQFSLVAFVLLFGLSKSLSAAEFKLAIIDFQQALNGVDEGKAAKAKLQKEFDEKKKDLDARKVKLDKLQSEIQELQQKATNPAMMSPEFMEKGRKLETEFRKQFEEYSKLAEQNQKDISGKEASATQEILEKLRAIVVDLGRAGAFTMIVEKNQSGLVYASDKTDLTEKAIQIYNSQHKGAAAKKEAPAK